MTALVLKIATRSSRLALWQAEYTKSLIEAAVDDVTVEIVHIKTGGDKNQKDALRLFGGVGVFTREVQTAVLKGETDIAVHSLKDLPTQPTDGLTLAGIPDRAPTADALLLPEGRTISSIDDIPQGARIGTGSPRRQAQLLNARPDLQMLEIRGNVDTRIRKLDDGEYDAIVLAEAGLRRLKLDDRISLIMQPPLLFTAVGQGALGWECRSDDERTVEILRQLTNPIVAASVEAERSLLAALRAGCHAPLGVETVVSEASLTLTAVLLSADGKHKLVATSAGNTSAAASVGVSVSNSLLADGGEELVATV